MKRRSDLPETMLRDEVMALLHISSRMTMRRYAMPQHGEKPRLPYKMIGGRATYLVDDVYNYMTQG